MNCEQCTLREEKQNGTCLSYIPPIQQYDILFVGQAPGKTEIITGQPFTGSAGKMLFSLCKEAGLIKREIPQANLVICKPPDDGKGNDRQPTGLEIKCCESQLKETIWTVQPKLIIAFGTAAVNALTGKSPISSLHGSFHSLTSDWEYECQVLCMYHPSFVMRQRQHIPVAIKDLKLVHTFFTQGIQLSKEQEYLLDPPLDHLVNYLQQGKGKVTDWDTETTGLNKRRDRVIGMSFSVNDNSAAAVYFTEGDTRLQFICEWLGSKHFKKSTQNGSYDFEITYSSLGVEPQGWAYDTKLAEQLLNSDLPKDLDHLRAMYTNMEPYKPSRKEMSLITSWGKERMLLYAAKDALCTGLVRRGQLPLLGEKQMSLMTNTLIPASLVLNRMERRGMKLDIPQLALMYADVLPKIQKLEDEIQEEIGINPNSPKQIKEAFGLDSSDREALEELIARGHEKKDVLEKILECRDLSKGASTFLRGAYERQEEGYIHTEYNITGTGTGRLSSKNPNLQNIRKAFRVIYIPPDEDHVILAGDYKQLELFVGGYLAPGDTLLTALRGGMDIHGMVLERIKDHIPERLMWNARNVAKTVVFGTFYGRSARSIAIYFGVPINTAMTWKAELFNIAPELQGYIEDRSVDFRQRGFVETPFGRKRFVQSIPQAVNAPIQSTANDVKLKALIALDQAGFDLRLDVHDEIVAIASKKDVIRQAKLMKEIMELPVAELGGMTFKVEMKAGSNWYEMQEIDFTKKKGGLKL